MGARVMLVALLVWVVIPGVGAEEAKPAAPPEAREVSTTAVIKFVEKFGRSFKKVKTNPFFDTAPRTRIDQYDKGNFSIIGTMPIPSFVPGLIDAGGADNFQFGLELGRYSYFFDLSSDPDLDTQKGKAKFQVNQTINGKPIAVLRAQISFKDEELRFSIKGTYVGIGTANVGYTVFARDYTNSDGEVVDVDTANIYFGGPTPDKMYTALNFPVPIVGSIKSAPFMDTSFKTLKMGFVGTNATK